jgi:pilus assembly protein FimV
LETEGWDEFALKMDLARAYIGMEDPDAAKEILNEAIATSSGEQRQEAEALLAELVARGVAN